MKHAFWLLIFVSAIGFAQSAPEPAPLPAAPTQLFQVLPAPRGRLYFPQVPIYIPSGPNQKAPIFLTGPMPSVAPVICAVPLIRAPLGNSEKMPISVPPVISKETDIAVPAPACDELSVNSK
jgi:hypothetical protein